MLYSSIGPFFEKSLSYTCCPILLFSLLVETSVHVSGRCHRLWNGLPKLRNSVFNWYQPEKWLQPDSPNPFRQSSFRQRFILPGLNISCVRSSCYSIGTYFFPVKSLSGVSNHAL